MRISGSLAKGLSIALAVALIPVTAVSAQKITPGATCKAVSYTHLTLPTNREV